MALTAPAHDVQLAPPHDARQVCCSTGIEIAGWSVRVLAVHAKSADHPWGALPHGIASVLSWLGEVTLDSRWRLELLPQGIHFRRHYHWSAIAWTQICAVESVPGRPGSRRESVVLTLASHTSQILGTFDGIFARTLRDRLRYEIAQRRSSVGA